MDLTYLFTSTTGRISRKDWWIGVVILIVIGIVVGLIINFALGGMFTPAGRIVLFLLQLVFAYPSYALSGKRFQDRNKPASFALIGVGLGLLKGLLDLIGVTGNPFAPNAIDWVFNIALLIVGIWFLVELGFLRGTVGSNNYGADPLESPRGM
jgi:uncharacterized membrane protein YhaH (DUF805 family)